MKSNWMKTGMLAPCIALIINFLYQQDALLNT